MKKNDLPLLQWEQPAKVLMFPLHKRIGKVRHTASLLITKHGEDAELYWKQVAAANRKHFDRIGLSEEQSRIEFEAFSQAVHAEMIRLSLTKRDTGGVA
ncbi:MAG: hypothetical protein IH622_03680 [Ochrobactrum anthropi]|uniref:Uncharacterized protein n=1 Tax=Brucella anthropi TaxID=529 RepID=A0A8I0T816_BRUAN|nr:DUF6074 family protein [Brucella anthropi]MBE0559920.1 hypothetical protein [Brucella anthropi]